MIVRFSKWQHTIDTSTFGSKFITVKTAIDLIEVIPYQQQMFSAPLGGPINICPTIIFCDNEAVVLITTHPESTKISISICQLPIIVVMRYKLHDLCVSDLSKAATLLQMY
jgi:hypothetical protein